MSVSKPVVLLSEPEDDQPSEAIMNFRLIYDGELRPTGRDPEGEQRDPLASHKHKIRQEFHLQLKQLWQTNKFLSEAKISRANPNPSRPISDDNAYWGGEDDEEPLGEVVADLYKEYCYRFLPLVRDQWSLLCTLRILFLRRDIPGSVLHAGDIDNRIKTLIDTLRRPSNATELVGHETPETGEDPFYVLMEDDKQVSHFEVETDTLLDPPTNDEADKRRSRVIITVELRPYYPTTFNLSFS